MALLALAGCRRAAESATVDDNTGEVLTSEAKYLKLIQGDGYVTAEVSTPWSGGEPIATYRIAKPLERSVVFSSVHTSAIGELGAMDRVAGVADAAYFVPTDTVAVFSPRGV